MKILFLKNELFENEDSLDDENIFVNDEGILEYSPIYSSYSELITINEANSKIKTINKKINYFNWNHNKYMNILRKPLNK